MNEQHHKKETIFTRSTQNQASSDHPPRAPLPSRLWNVFGTFSEYSSEPSPNPSHKQSMPLGIKPRQVPRPPISIHTICIDYADTSLTKSRTQRRWLQERRRNLSPCLPLLSRTEQRRYAHQSFFPTEAD